MLLMLPLLLLFCLLAFVPMPLLLLLLLPFESWPDCAEVTKLAEVTELAGEALSGVAAGDLAAA